MPITLITGPANAGKAREVLDAARRHLARGEEPLLIVPTRADAEHYQRELAAAGAALGVTVERFGGLVAEVARRAGVAAPALGGVARERVLAAIAGEVDPDGDGLARGPGFARALSAFVAELQVRRVSPARLSAALAQLAPGTVPDLGGMFARYQRALRALGRADAEQRALRALDALRREPALWGARPVLFYGFDDLTRLQIDAIETLGRFVDASVTVSLTYEPGRTAFAGRASTFAALAPLAAEHRRLDPRADYYAPAARGALSHLERSLFEPGSAQVDPGAAIKLLAGGGERAELELVAREIAVLLGDGMAPEEIAVVLRSGGAGVDLLEEVFADALIPFALQRRRRFADTATGRALVGLLRCVPAASPAPPERDGEAPRRPAGGGDAADLLAWLRAPGVLRRPELADLLEARIRREGASSAEQARALWETANWQLETIDHLEQAQARGPRALLERSRRELEWLFAAPRRGAGRTLAGDELDEAGALAAGQRALGELVELARAAPELAPRDARELASILAGLELLSGERPAPGSVSVVEPLALRARRVRALFLCGMQEGVFPAAGSPPPLLAEEQRRRLAESAGLNLGEYEDALAAERYLFYAMVSRPRELLVLSWHTARDDGSSRAPSLFVEDVCDLFDGTLRERCSDRSLGATGWPELDGERGAGAADGAPAPQPIAPLSDPGLLAELRDHTWSASSLELWIGCPVRWLVERMLRAEDLDPHPEPLARGGLAHLALKETLEGLRRETGSARVTPGVLDLARELLTRSLRERASQFPLSAAPERRPGLRRRLQADLERYLEHAARAASATPAPDDALEPAHLELEFGFAERDEQGAERGLPALDLGEGVTLRGRIDRVDVGARGEAVVYDYKGASVAPASKWIEERDLQVALYMRAVEELLGLAAVGGFYQPLTGADLRARGVLDADSGLELECVGGDRREHAEVRALLDQALAAARRAAGEAARGELEARPQSCAFRGGCAYPTICRSAG